MGQEEVDRIKDFFSQMQIFPVYLEHEAVITSEDAAKTRGFKLKQGIKAILLTNEKDFVVVNIPADKKVDIKKVAEKINNEAQKAMCYNNIANIYRKEESPKNL